MLAALSVESPVRTGLAIERTTLDKVPVSRALLRLETKALVARLLPAGRAVFRKIVSLVIAREAYLLEALAPEDRAALDRALTQLTERARLLRQQG